MGTCRVCGRRIDGYQAAMLLGFHERQHQLNAVRELFQAAEVVSANVRLRPPKFDDLPDAVRPDDTPEADVRRDAEMARLCQAVDTVKRVEDQLQKDRGDVIDSMVPCEDCGQPVPPGPVTCGHCGYKFPPSKARNPAEGGN